MVAGGGTGSIPEQVSVQRLRGGVPGIHHFRQRGGHVPGKNGVGVELAGTAVNQRHTDIY